MKVLIAIAIIYLLCLSCTQQVAGTDNGSETTNGIVAAVVDQSGSPARNAVVNAAPASLTPEDFTWFVYSTKTDSQGNFSIRSMDPGVYTLEILSNNGNEAIVLPNIAIGDSLITLDKQTLAPAAILAGNIDGADSASHTVFISGLDRAETTLSDV